MMISAGKMTTVKQLLSEMAGVIPDNARFEAAVATATCHRLGTRVTTLSALQQQEDGQTEPYYVPSEELTLEHIFPENPGSEWDHIPSTSAEELLNKLGNQALLPATVNSGLGNVGYSTKKASSRCAQSL